MGGLGSLDLLWVPSDGNRAQRKRQTLQRLSCVPIVIIPTDTVPINFALFFVSPFHQRSQELRRGLPEDAARGFVWREESEDTRRMVPDAAEESEEDGVQVVYRADDPDRYT